MTIKIDKFAARIKIGKAQQKGRLTLYPIFIADAEKKEERLPLSYMLLEDAIDSGSFEIGEISESGTVNTVVITNLTGQPVLILDGEEIVGAKQNRMVNATILVAADRRTTVPVSCVEQGRWQYSSEKFGKSEAFGYSTLRRQKAEQVNASLETESSFTADQGAIWSEIAFCESAMGTESPTGALSDTYRKRDRDLVAMTDNFKQQTGQLGLLVYINNRFVCLDLFDKPDTLEKLWSRLLKSYAVEALSSRKRSAENAQPTPAAVIEEIDKSEYMTYPSVGLGDDLRINGPVIIGAGLLLDQQIVHLSVFRKEQHRDSDIAINTPHRRRRNLG